MGAGHRRPLGNQNQRTLHLRNGPSARASKNSSDQALWRDWYTFTLELALIGAFSTDATEQKMARIFIDDALAKSGQGDRRLRESDGPRGPRWRLCRRVRNTCFGSSTISFMFSPPAAGGEIRARRSFAGRLPAARAVLCDQRRRPAELREEHRGLYRLSGRKYRARVARYLARLASSPLSSPRYYDAAAYKPMLRPEPKFLACCL